MEDQVPFKVFTFWNEHQQPEVRRFAIEKSVATSFHYLNAKLLDIYPGLRGRKYTVSWKDEEGDDIIISSDDEVKTALTALQGNLFKLDVCFAHENKEDVGDISNAPITPTAEGQDKTHYSVTCDGCNSQVVGFRYKCTSCYDFDLCSKCESAGLHPEHFMVRLPSPAVPRALVKAAIKRSRHFLKTIASVAPGDAYKRHRRERSPSADRRKHSRGERHHQQDHCRRPRASWLDTFTTYMNEFANLAGDTDRTRQPEDSTKQAEKPTETTATPRPEQTTASANPTAEIMENLPKLAEMYFNGCLASYLQNAGLANPAPSTNENLASNVPPNPQTPAAPKDEDMDDAVKKAQDILKSTVKDELEPSTSGEAGRDGSPDKADGWTMINKEKEFMEACEDKPSAPAAGVPIGFNLPQEFQERMKIHEGQSLYPPLNTATAVMNPKEPEGPREPVAPQTSRAPTAPQAAGPQPQPQPQPLPHVPHPLAHIDAAIRQMLMMGFTNEGGWLTKLLESKDGNIAAVLDLLTPPKSV